ncbi:MAG: cytochrome P450 [Deltaproteobacteria bacterium]|nr:cytochrome P450 [Deltaproteobacteria bacterium]
MTAPDSNFALGDLKNAEDPYRLYEAARADGPIQRSGESWLIFGHHEATELLRSSSTRSGFMADGYRDRLPPGAAREEMSHRINFLDPPQHTRVRRLVGKAFTPRRTELLRPFVEEVARKLLRSLPGYQAVDLVKAYAHEVPSLVISELLGVPVEYRDRLTLLSDRVSRLLGTVNDQAELTDAIAAAEEMHETLRDLVKARRKKPEDDLLSDLIAVEDENERLSESELLSLAATLYSAGHRTTRDLFANGLASFLPQRDLIRAVLDGELPSAAVVEEFLRFETPTHMIARTVAEPLELRGHTLSPGEPIIVLLAAANRDPSVYTFADVFEPWRWTRRVEPAPPLSFALGAHFCLGASLARLEANIMLDVLLDTYPEMSLADETLRWHHTGVFRGLDSLPVILGARLERLPRPGSE